MMMCNLPTAEPLLSICIPTRNRAAILQKALQSITFQNYFNEVSNVEIVISNNCSNDNTHDVVAEFIEKYPDKIIYSRTDENITDRNFERVLRMARGKLLKLANDSLIWIDRSVEYLAKIADSTQRERRPIFFTNGILNNTKDLNYLGTVDEFIQLVGYNATWIGGYSIWRNDLEAMKDYSREWATQLVQLDAWYRLLTERRISLVVNTRCFQVQDVGRKGGYSFAKVFGQNYLKLLRKYSADIDEEAYRCEKKNVFLNHILPWQLSPQHDVGKEVFEEYLVDYIGETYFHEVMAGLSNGERDIRVLTAKEALRTQQGEWRQKNKHNHTTLTELSPIENISVGRFTKGDISLQFAHGEQVCLKIGHLVSICADVKFIFNKHPDLQFVTTFPVLESFAGQGHQGTVLNTIAVGSDVWLGESAIVLGNVDIGQGAVIMAASVVSGNVPPYSVVQGNPARVIGYRFGSDVIELLMNINYERINLQMLESIQGLLQSEVSRDVAENILLSLNMIDQ